MHNATMLAVRVQNFVNRARRASGHSTREATLPESQQLQDDAMEMGSLAGSLKRSLEEKNKGVFGGVFKH